MALSGVAIGNYGGILCSLCGTDSLLGQRSVRKDWQPDDESCPLIRSTAIATDSSAVHLDDVPRDRES
jgi:hypothetical protein